jgi:hypothetical protein
MALSAATVSAVTRTVIGASCWLFPITACRLFGIDASKDVAASLYLRLGGSRDFALAAGPLLTEGASRRRMIQVAAGCDVGDIAAVLIAHRRGEISTAGATLFIGASAACLALGAKALTETAASSRRPS